MKIFKKILKEHKEIDKVFCDKCNQEIVLEGYDAFESSFECQFGNEWPDYSSVDSYKVELCKNCTRQLLENFKKNGYRVMEKESWDNEWRDPNLEVQKKEKIKSSIDLKTEKLTQSK